VFSRFYHLSERAQFKRLIRAVHNVKTGVPHNFINRHFEEMGRRAVDPDLPPKKWTLIIVPFSFHTPMEYDSQCRNATWSDYKISYTYLMPIPDAQNSQMIDLVSIPPSWYERKIPYGHYPDCDRSGSY
jgi:hypothetical protein